MDGRAGVVIVSGGRVALVERTRGRRRYLVFPGGEVEAGESASEAAAREALEELGVVVAVSALVAELRYPGRVHRYFRAEVTGGRFGAGTGEEMTGTRPERGSYRPCWVDVDELAALPVRPVELAALVADWTRNGWPVEPVVIEDPRAG